MIRPSGLLPGGVMELSRAMSEDQATGQAAMSLEERRAALEELYRDAETRGRTVFAKFWKQQLQAVREREPDRAANHPDLKQNSQLDLELGGGL